MLSTRQKFTIGGTVFGLCFPVVSTLIACSTRQVTNGCLRLHAEEPLLLVIDTAPFILGAFAYLIGRSIEGKLSHERAAKEAMRLREVEQRAAAERLAQQNKDLTELNEMLDGLVYTASHDLKTPVINFQSMLKMLRSIKDKPDNGLMMDNIIRRMEAATFRFQDTIAGLLDISRVERLGDDLPMTSVEVQDLAMSTWESIGSFAESKGASLQWGAIEAPILVTNQESLQSVFLNLLTNAVKYADPQRPCVVEIATQSRPGRTTILVKDNGIGIDLATHGDKLFRMFKRFTSQGEGSGIGLYIVRRTLQKLGADIRVESQLGQGSTFILDFPTT